MKKTKGIGFLCMTLCLLMVMSTSVFAAQDTTKHEEVSSNLVESVRALDNTTVQVVFAGEVKDKKVNFVISEAFRNTAALEIKKVSFSDDGRTAAITTGSQGVGKIYTLYIQDVHVKHLGKADEISWIFAGVGIKPVPVLDPSPVQISSIAAVNNTQVDVTFDMEVDVTNAIFSIPNNDGTTALEVTGYSLGADGRTVSVFTAPQTVGVIYTMKVSDVKTLDGRVSNTLSGIFGGMAPPPPPPPPPPTDPSPVQISSIAAVNNTRVDVTFDMEVDITNAIFSIPNNDGTQALEVTGYSLGTDGRTVSVFTAPQTAGRLYTMEVSGVKTLDGRVSNTLSGIFAGNGTPLISLKIASVIALNNTTVLVTFNTEADLSNANIAFTDMMGMQQALTTIGYELSADNKTATIYTSPQTAGMLYKVVISGAKTLDGNVANTLSAIFAGTNVPAN